ncbi:MAG TPA: hypothetical protein DCL77_20330 [Prolixibacteraceae bacterium]|jgi:hypothetical protein|nr:hypothetical protein [Prolixibacteraceae bacterium]
MVFKKYISKHILLRLCLLIALISSAAVFDMYHTSSQKLADSLSRVPLRKDMDGCKMFFCNQVNTYNLKTPAGEFSVRFRLAYTQDKFLVKHYNLRTFQLMKAESLHSFFPVICSFHSLPFNRVLYSSPDDIPPLS